MRLLVAAALGSLLVASMSGTDIERAQSLARARDSERQQFHRRYVIDLPDPVVTQIEVTTEFRRLVLISEEHVLRGDWMFTRSLRAAEDALAPARGLVTLNAQLRFNPMNAFIEPPAYALALGGGPASAPLAGLITQVMPQYSVPFKTRDNRTLSSLIGARLEAAVAAERLGPTERVIAVMLDGKEITHTSVDFRRLD